MQPPSSLTRAQSLRASRSFISAILYKVSAAFACTYSTQDRSLMRDAGHATSEHSLNFRFADQLRALCRRQVAADQVFFDFERPQTSRQLLEWRAEI